MKTKTCTTCELNKSTDEFHLNRKKYRTSQCIQCYKDKGHEINLKRYYGLTLEKYNEIKSLQDNKCAICKQPETAIYAKTGKVKTLSVDHCHKTGTVRGLLCTNCNHALGKFKEDITLLQSAESYLIKYNKQQENT